MPSVFQHHIQGHLVVLDLDRYHPPFRVSLVRHLHQDLMPLSHQSTLVDVPIHLGELGESVVDDVLALEFRPVLVEVVRHEERDVIHPCIARSTRQ